MRVPLYGRGTCRLVRRDDLHRRADLFRQGTFSTVNTLAMCICPLPSAVISKMRRTIAVFSGMLGVTLFGIFLTPVFYSLIQWIADWREGVNRSSAASDLASGG